MTKARQPVLGNVVALCVGILVAFILAEVLSRVLIPIFPGTKKLDLDGHVLNIGYVHKGAVYRQYSEEYDALTTITQKGYRIPEVVDNPHMIFVGDSFTFGQGLSDEHTFPYQVCHTLQVSCGQSRCSGCQHDLRIRPARTVCGS